MGGRVKSTAAIAADFFRALEREARANPGRALTGIVSPDVLYWIQAQGSAVSEALTRRGIAQAKFVENGDMPREKFDVSAA